MERVAIARARPRADSLVSLLDRIAGSAWFAYGSIFLIQAKVLWGIWEYRDLSSGDTSEYFTFASTWAHSLHVVPLWNPLYTVLWGSTQWLIHDPYASTILHRALIAIAASLLVLAVLRLFLTPGIAWGLAVWWAILPVNYDALYEVHLFALLPELAAVLIALTWKGLRMRASVFALFLLVTLLLRNEIALSLSIWTAAWLAYELWERRRGLGTPRRRLITAFALPILAVSGLMALAIARSYDHDAWGEFQAKQELNLCQSYAFGYQQRNDDFTGSPFLDCGRLMQRDFGEGKPSLTTAITANPGAIADQVAWNVRLVPYGLQLMLFDRISGAESHSPDYAPVRAGSRVALVGSILLAGFVVAGLVLLWRDRDRWWRNWIQPRAWGWLALGSLAATILPVLVWQRPRPEYLFALNVFILSVIGLCAMAFVDRWPGLKPLRAVIPVAALLLVVLLPAHFSSGYETPLIGRPGRPLKAMVERLYPMREQLRGDEVRLLATYAAPGCHYVGEYDPCTPVDWTAVLARSPAVEERQALAASGADFIYVDRDDLQNPAWRELVKTAMRSGWVRVGPPLAQGWTLLRRASTTVPNANATSSAT